MIFINFYISTIRFSIRHLFYSLCKIMSFDAGSSAKADQSEETKVTETKEPPHKGYLEDIRVTLPSSMIAGAGKN